MSTNRKQFFILARILAIPLLLLPLAPASAYAAIEGQDSVHSAAPDRNRGAETQQSTQQSQKTATPDKPAQKAEDWTVAFYPILAWAPIMGASVDLPDQPPLPGGSVPAGEVSGSLNGLALFGFSVQKARFVGDLSVLWGKVSATSTNPKNEIGMGFLFADASAGVKIYRGLALTGGVRRLGMKIDATLGDSPQVTWKPGVTDPMLGLQMRSSLSKKWGVDLRFEGGGFGVGSDVDVSAQGRFDWRFARHFGLTIGYGALHFKITSGVTVEGKTYTREANQTLHGPVFGFGIYF